MTTLLPKPMLEPYLLGSLHWSATISTREDQKRWLQHYAFLSGRGFHHLPFFLIVDLSCLLEHGLRVRFVSDARHGNGMADWSDQERTLRLQYENQLLSRLLMEPSMLEAIDVLDAHRSASGAGSSQFVGRLRHLLMVILGQITSHIPAHIRINPAHLRACVLPHGDSLEAIRRFEDHLQQTEVMQTQMTHIVQAARKIAWSTVLSAVDRFELEHHDVLQTRSDRMGCRQVLSIAHRLGDIDTRQVSISDEGLAETAFVDETHYPTGGLTGLTNRGSIENIVLSELVYIDPSMDVDLFDLRMVEGELLYYLRDDGVLRRKRRTVHLVLDAAHSMRHKPMGHDHQLSVLLSGLMLRLVWDLRAIFTLDALQLKLHIFHPDGEQTYWNQEVDLLKLLLRDDMEKHQLDINCQPTCTPDDFYIRCQNPKQKVYVISFSTADTWMTSAVSFLQATPPIYGMPISVQSQATPPPTGHLLPIEGASWAQLTALKNNLLIALAGLHRGGTS